MDAPEVAGRYAFAAVVADLTDLLDALEISTAIWVGYSMGGRVALGAGLLAADRVAGLVLESASPGIADRVEREARRLSDARIADRLVEGDMESFVAEWESKPLFASQGSLPRPILEAQRRQRLCNRPAALAACLRGLGTGMQPSFWDGLSHLKMPALLIVGEDDEKYLRLNRQMAEEMPDASLAVVTGAGHNVHLERPRE
ncbi:MAG: alpha/beta fold hydrolase [Gemmatimonadota bacterium]